MRLMHCILFALSLMARLAHSAPPAPSADSPALNDVRAADLMATALFARDAGPEELRKMEGIYTDLVARYPQNAMVKNAQAEFLWSTGNHARAVEGWLAAEKLDPKNAVVLDHLGGSLLAAGNARKAASYYARATDSEPGNAAYHFNYANVAFLFRHELLDEKRPDATAVLHHALEHFSDACRLQPLNPEYARAYAETFYTVPDADWAKALQAWKHFHEISPAKDFALINMARVYLKLGDKTAARESLSRVQGTEFDRLKNRLKERIDTE